MIIIPKETPVVESLNSYYLNIKRLVEHFQGELGAGVVYFKAPAMECAVFFDEYQVVNGCVETKQGKTVGKAAIDRIMELSARNNFFVSVFKIRPDRLYFWSNLPDSEVIYSDLTTEFTDLEGLIRKLEGEKFTGYIDVQLSGEDKGGLLFLFDGEVIGGLRGDNQETIDRSDAFRKDVIRRAREQGGKFTVSRIFLDRGQGEGATPPGKTKEVPSSSGISAIDEPVPGKTDARVLEMLESLLATLEQLVRKNRKIRQDFDTLLNKKFIEKADKYDFLDPFVAEFRYSGGKLTFTGQADPETLAKSVSECVSEIAAGLNMTSDFRKALQPWQKQFADEAKRFGLRL